MGRPKKADLIELGTLLADEMSTIDQKLELLSEFQSSNTEPSWLSLEFTGYEPDDSGSSLHRKWKGLIKAVRSDGETIAIPLISLQLDGPRTVGEDLIKALARLDTYRTCPCSVESGMCDYHNPAYNKEETASSGETR